MQKWIVAIAAIGFMVVAAPALSLGKSAGPVTFETLDGHSRTMNNYDERPATVVVFLSGRCETTIAQFSAINALHEKYRQDEVLFVGVVANPEESGEELRTFQQNTGCRFPIYRDTTGEVVKKFGATVTPSFYMLDTKGKLLYTGGMGGAADGLEPIIKAVLAKEKFTAVAVAASGTPIDKPGPKREIPDPYRTMAFSSELIFTKIPGVAVHHCSTITEAPNGDMLCLWYAGSYESSEDQALYISRLPKGQRIWTEPKRLIWNPEAPTGNAVIFTAPDKRVWIIWGRMEGSRPTRRGSGWSTCRLIARTSSDNGETWTEDYELPDTFGWLPRNTSLQLKDGRFVLPVSGDVDDVYAGFLMVLEDNNRTWKRIGLMPGGEQPTVIERDNGELLSLMRGHPRVKQSVSKDGGNTWSTPENTELNCPDSGVAATKLASGRVLLAYNNTPEWDRTPFNIIQSTDDGKTWGETKVIEQDWGEFSYPCIIQSSDGMIHLTYTYRRWSIKHVTFDENWLILKDRPN